MAAGYSGTPLPKKLGMKPGRRVVVVNGPDDFTETLGELPAGVAFSTRLAGGPYGLVVLFVKSQAELTRRFSSVKEKLAPDGGVWIAWPKKASGVATDLSDNAVREFGLAGGLVDNKVCAIDETWSGLHFVFRLKDRPEVTRKRMTRGQKPGV